MHGSSFDTDKKEKTNMTDAMSVWLEHAAEKAVPGTMAEKSVKLIRELYNALDKMAGCENCLHCSEYAEDIIERCDDIVEEL